MRLIIAVGVFGATLLVLAGCGATASPGATSVPTIAVHTSEPSPPVVTPSPLSGSLLPDLIGATTILLQDDWTGLSPLAPIEAHYDLKRGAEGFSGEANFSMAGYRTPEHATETITVPMDVALNFLQTLQDPSMQIKQGAYEPLITHTDDYPEMGIQLELPNGEKVVFYSESQGEDNVPWGLKFGGQDYTVNSPQPSKALGILSPYLRKDEVLSMLEQRLVDRAKTPTP